MKYTRLTGLAAAIALALTLSACSALDNINGT